MLEPLQIRLALRRVESALALACQPPPRLTVDVWADKHRELSRIANRKGGRWRTRRFQREIMRETTNPANRSVVLIAAAQTGGKSEIILNFCGRQIHLNPGPMMLVQPTNELAERFSKKRIAPMMRDTPVLRGLVADEKSRKSNNTIRQKEYPGGALNIAGANTPNELCSDPIRDVLIDEVDRCEEAAGKEGDIVTLAEKRQEDFGEDAFSLYTSTPSGKKPRPLGDKQPEGVSKITLLFMESDQRYFFCPCRSCGHMQALRWSQVQWPEGAPEDARYVCEVESCGYHHTDAERLAMIEAGEWRATAPFRGRAGFFLNGIYSVSPAQRGCVSKLHQMVKDFIRANARGKESLRAWVNTFLCECFEDREAQNVDPDLLYNRREPYGPKLPEKVAILTGGMDVHPDRIEIQVVGWGEGEECWAVDYQVHTFDTSNKEMIHALLLAAMDKTYEHPGGREIAMTRLCADTGHRTDEVHYACQKLAMRGVIPVRGKPLEGAPVLYLPRKEGKARRRLWLVSTNAAKSVLYSRFTLSDRGPGYVHFPSDRPPHFEKEYFKQVTAEHLFTEMKMGREIRRFELPSGARNEALDTFVYALAALRYDTNPNFARMLARLNAKPEETAKETPQPARRRSSFVSDWR